MEGGRRKRMMSGGRQVRVYLLDEEVIEPFQERKMEERKVRTLVEWMG